MDSYIRCEHCQEKVTWNQEKTHTCRFSKERKPKRIKKPKESSKWK